MTDDDKSNALRTVAVPPEALHLLAAVRNQIQAEGIGVLPGSLRQLWRDSVARPAGATHGVMVLLAAHALAAAIKKTEDGR